MSFDLVITDRFSRDRTAVVAPTLAVRTAVGATPVVRFTAHLLELAEAQLAGFHDLLTKPCAIASMAQQVRTLRHRLGAVTPVPPVRLRRRTCQPIERLRPRTARDRRYLDAE